MSTSAVSIKLSEAERARWSELAKSTKRSTHSLMRVALSEFLDEMEWRRDFLEEAEASWRHYKETGLHVTQEELEKWVENPSGEFPKCHV